MDHVDDKVNHVDGDAGMDKVRRGRPPGRRKVVYHKTELYDLRALRSLRCDVYYTLPPEMQHRIDTIMRTAEEPSTAKCPAEGSLPPDVVQKTVAYWRHEGLKNGNSTERTVGRAFVQHSVGLQSMWGSVRGVLAKRIYTDIDVVNCAATLASHVAKQVGVRTPHLDEYVRSREDVLRDIASELDLTRAEAKRTVLRTMFGASDSCGRSIRLASMGDECAALAEEVYRRSNAGEEDECVARGARHRALARYLFDLEHQVLMALQSCLCARGWLCDVHIFDGALVRHRDRPDAAMGEEELHIITRDVRNSTKVRGLRFAIKPLDGSLIEPSPGQVPPALRAVADEQGAADVVNETTDAYVRKVGRNSFMLRTDEAVWEPASDHEAMKEVGSRIPRMRLWLLNKATPAVAMSSHVSTCHADAIAAMALRQMAYTRDFCESMVRSCKGKLFFKSGYWDFGAGKFIDREGPDVCTPVRVRHEFPARPSDEVACVYRQRVLHPIFPDPVERECFLAFVARGLAGHTEDKLWGAWIGDRNCGKSVFNQALIAAFGSYVCAFSGNDLVRKDSGREAARVMEFALEFEFARLAFSQEIDEKGDVDGMMLKRICSGGDIVKAREIYQRTKQFACHARVCVCANALPRIDPEDAKQTGLRFNGRTVFVSGPLTAKQRRKNADRASGKTFDGYARADDTVADYVRTDAAIASLTYELIDAYARARRGDWIASAARMTVDRRELVEQVLEETYEACDDKDSVVFTADVVALLRDHGIEENDKSGRLAAEIGRVLCKVRGGSRTSEGTELATHPCTGRRARGYRGVRRISVPL